MATPIPVLTATLSGFVNNETNDVVQGSADLSSAALTNSPVGPYDIVAALGSLSATNYSFVTSNGTLTVTKGAVSITATDAARTYGHGQPGLHRNNQRPGR